MTHPPESSTVEPLDLGLAATPLHQPHAEPHAEQNADQNADQQHKVGILF